MYGPDAFYRFCSRPGANNLFDFIFAFISTSRHTKERTELNKKRTAAFFTNCAFVYLWNVIFCRKTMCCSFCLSLKRDFLQKDNALFLHFFPWQMRVLIPKDHLALPSALEGSREKFLHFLLKILFIWWHSEKYHRTWAFSDLNDWWLDESLLEEMPNQCNFCAIIINITKEVNPIPAQEPRKIHNPVRIDIKKL